MSKRIIIIGGGVIGFASAWHCLERGHHVTLIERRDLGNQGCSYGNAGMIVPSHFMPLASPGMIRLGLKWMWNPESPFYIRPRMSWDLVHWLWEFRRACTIQHVEQVAPLLRDLNLAGRQCFIDLEERLSGGFGLVPNGLLMLCKTKEAMHEETEVAQRAQELDVEARVLNANEVAEIDTGIETDVRGAVYFPLDCRLSPNRLMSALQDDLTKRDCEIHWSTECNGFNTKDDRIHSIETTAGEIAGDEFVICGGAWSDQIANQLQLRLPLQAGKGYSLTLDQPRELPNICSILQEARVAVTPMGSALRFGGTMEIAGKDESISQARLRGIIRSIPRYFPSFQESDFAGCSPWVGLRPCSPDGLPYLGRSRRWTNALVNAGHGMMGISLSLISGRLIAQMIDGESPAIRGVEQLSPDRYAK